MYALQTCIFPMDLKNMYGLKIIIQANYCIQIVAETYIVLRRLWYSLIPMLSCKLCFLITKSKTILDVISIERIKLFQQNREILMKIRLKVSKIYMKLLSFTNFHKTFLEQLI